MKIEVPKVYTKEEKKILALEAEVETLRQKLAEVDVVVDVMLNGS